MSYMTLHSTPSGGGAKGGGGTPLLKPCMYVPPNRVGYLRRFGLNTPCPFSSGIGYGFRGNYGVYEGIYLFNSK